MRCQYVTGLLVVSDPDDDAIHTGLWCDTCLLPSSIAFTAPMHVLTGYGVAPAGMLHIRGCEDCGDIETTRV